MNRKKVLLIDKKETILNTYYFLLRKEGYYVVTANSEMRALEKFCRYSFDLVITDLAMNDGKGLILSVIKILSPNTPVIVFINNRSKIARKFLSLLEDYVLIEKTSSYKVLISCVRNSLTRSNQKILKHERIRGAYYGTFDQSVKAYEL